MDRSDLCLSFNSTTRDGSNVHIFPTGSKQRHSFLSFLTFIVYFLLGNLRISESFPDILLKVRCELDLSIMKYFSAISFCGQMASILHYHSKYYF